MFIHMSSVVCICIFAKLFIEMYMYICFEGLREDWLSQLSYPHKIKKLLTYLLMTSEKKIFEYFFSKI